VNKSWLIPGATVPAARNGQVSSHGTRDHCPKEAAIKTQAKQATAGVGVRAQRDSDRYCKGAEEHRGARGEQNRHYLELRPLGRIVAPMELRAAVDICRERPTLRRTLTIALVVGCILSIINEGDVLVHGNATGATAVKICFNFVVPFIVSNLGVLAGKRTARM
jgi:hypothetical protein